MIDLTGRIGGYAPGNYDRKCCTCGDHFDGDKRAITCRTCALEHMIQHIYRRCSDTEHPDEIPSEIVGMIEGTVWSANRPPKPAPMVNIRLEDVKMPTPEPPVVNPLREANREARRALSTLIEYVKNHPEGKD